MHRKLLPSALQLKTLNLNNQRSSLQELGIDISDAPQQKLTPEVAQQAALLVTMGCGEACPYVPGQFLAIKTSQLSPPTRHSRIQVHSIHCTPARLGCKVLHQCSVFLANHHVNQYVSHGRTGLEKIDWPLADPKHMPVEGAREVRDDAAARVKELIKERGWGKAEQ